MHEGYVFLDEKCMLLAGEILRELGRHAEFERAMLDSHRAAVEALQAAIARHGLEDLQVYPALDQTKATLVRETRSIMGVRLQDAGWRPSDEAPRPLVQESPEGEACRRAFVAVIEAAARLAAVSGNLERLSFEYRRSVRRARALQDVLLPELIGRSTVSRAASRSSSRRMPSRCGGARNRRAKRLLATPVSSDTHCQFVVPRLAAIGQE